MSDATVREPDSKRTVQSVSVEVIAGPDQGALKTSPLAITIGTASNNELVLSDATVSRHHLEIARAGGEIRLSDLGSTNGTILAGARLERAAISPGTTLKIGRTMIRVTDGAPTEVDLHVEARLGSMIGASEGMRALMARLARVAASDASALILGETGTGKEVAARTIHEISARRDGPFEVVDCGAALPTLLASELFGHEKGAFTGADARHIGALERAAGGTLFIDEIGELPPALQTALLGVLERRSFRRLGGDSLLNLDARVLSATHRDLRSGVNDGSFRSDLYYRIAVVLLRIPPLRERIEDLPLLVEHFARRFGLRGAIDSVFPSSVMSELERHRWPGNVRELRNAIESAVVMGEPPALGEQGHAPAASASKASPEGGELMAVDRFFDLPFTAAKEALVEDFEPRYLRHLLDQVGGSVTQAAQRAGVHRTYLTRVIKRSGIRIRRTPSERHDSE